MDHLDWRWLRSFVAVTEEGSMKRAAAKTKISQPTLSRHIRMLEEETGIALFERHGRSLRLSSAGAGLFEKAVEVRDAVKAFERQVVGLDEGTDGPVRVVMSHMFGVHFAPAWLMSLKRLHPGISIDLMLDDSATNLWMREAEIAIRMFRPEQVGLKMRLCGETTMGFFASKEYLGDGPVPQDLQRLLEFDVIGFDRFMAWIKQAKEMGFDYKRNDFVLRSDSYVMHQLAAEQGMGVAVLPLHTTRRGDLVRLFPDVSMPGRPVYLTAVPELHRNPRVSRVWRHLVEHVTAYLEA